MTISEFFNELLSFDKSKFDLDYTNSFKNNIKACYKSHFKLELLCDAIKILAENGRLPAKYKSHELKEKKIMECHIQPDWLLIWIQNDKSFTLVCTGTGRHSDLFS